MRFATAIIFSLAFHAAVSGPAGAQSAACTAASGGLGVSRVVEIDTTSGPLYGDMSKYAREDSFLAAKEVVLTFDDGPMPWITKSILDTLDTFCTKATFFSVGQMALAYPDSVKDVLARGHTLGTHTWSHPMNIGRQGADKGIDQIERGFAAVALAAGQPIAPFFRFPGLNDSGPLLHHLQTRGIATFTVDVVSNDSYIASPSRLFERTIGQVEQRNGGIMLFHDIKASTAKALPGILTELQARGYKVVHMRAKAPVVPVASIEAELAPVLAKKMANSKSDTSTTHQLRPFYGSATLLQPSASEQSPTESPPEGSVGATSSAPVTALAPVAKPRGGLTTAGTTTRSSGSVRKVKRHLDSTADDTEAQKPKQRVRRFKKAAASTDNGSLFPF